MNGYAPGMVVRRVREEIIDEPDVVPVTTRRVITERRVGGGYGYGFGGNPVALVALALIVVLLLVLFLGVR